MTCKTPGNTISHEVMNDIQNYLIDSEIVHKSCDFIYELFKTYAYHYYNLHFPVA